ncbi:Fic family protein [Arthrobacter sp. Br18]|uniref:Fic family protein n=1 Tax=Arthrobacter sp. Br18 TaxID=1312954 RepID=UPI0004B231DD|nr:Fic family protein [Arthrobacter sp. Br18]
MRSDAVSRGGKAPHSSLWPAVTWEQRTWEPTADRGESHRTRLRARGPYDAAVPPFIAHLDLPPLRPGTAVRAEDAITELVRFDVEFSAFTASFAAILLRSESASSSEIEQLTAQPKSIALAELGGKSGPNARLIVANTRAMEAAIALSADLDEDAVLAMQAVLLADTHPEYTGRWRDQPVWIGGGAANSPHAASFVPPHADRVPALMTDLVAFAQRTDLPVMPQLAIAHAQFETIHPFPDGNGRTGRALIHSMLHRLGITRNLTVPVSAGLLQNTAGYFEALTAYREGSPTPIIDAFSAAFTSALSNGRQLVADLEEFRSWAAAATSARKGSAGARIVDLLLQHPVIDAKTVASLLGITAQNAQNGLDRLVAEGILLPSGEGRRNRTFESELVLAALDAFAQRARRRRSG